MPIGTAHCSSCGLALDGRGVVQFLCPQCGEETLCRCARCRDQSVAYTCPHCTFQGP
ncbi:MAG TPA: zinc finger domain-containing protein [Thermoplasmata archaeon]|nr:zinc finger domain-containing protein [Thermoplasmata archaeon]